MVFCCFKMPSFDFTLQPPTRNNPPEPEPPLRPLPTNTIRRQLTGENTAKVASVDPDDESPHPQNQSQFIARIPAELRLICWEYILGSDSNGDVIHLESADGILRHCRCFDDDKTKLGFRHVCWNAIFKKEKFSQGIWYSREPCDGRKLQSLILTCKLMQVLPQSDVALSNTMTQLS